MLTWIDKEIETDPHTDCLLAVNADKYTALLKASLPDGRNSAHDPCPCVEGQGMGPPC